MRIVLLMGEVIKLVDALVQILCSFSVATFQYGLKKVRLQTRTAIIVGAETELVCGSKNILCKVT